MLGEVPVLSNALEAALSSEGFHVRRLIPGRQTKVLGNHRYEVDFSSTQSLHELHSMLTAGDSKSKRPVGGVVSLLGLIEQVVASSNGSANGHHRDVRPNELPLWLFQTIKEFAGDLDESARSGGGLLVNFTSMGGSYAIHEPSRASAIQAAIVGVCKAAGREMPRIAVKNIDLDMTQPPDTLFPHVLQEIATAGSVEEIGIHDGTRVRVEVVESPLPETSSGSIDLDADSVVLITGGARGVTALTAVELARQTGSRFVLVGRTAIPKDEPSELRALSDESAIRQHFIAESRIGGQVVSPAQIERNVRAVLRDREIRQNILAISKHASQVVYRGVDVRDDAEFSRLIDSVYEQWGRIDAVIHGAGLIEDKLIRDKTPESFARVFGTKVDSAMTLVRSLRPETLKYLVFFASISGRFGNAGQADYSAANEYLSKLARKLDSEWPARVVAISWGPWDGGMVSGELRRMYIGRGIHPIPSGAGAAAMVNELRLRQGPPEILLGCNIRQIARLSKEGTAA